MSLLAAFLLYGALLPAFLVWWAYGRGPVENTSRAIQNEHRRFANRDGRAASRPGSTRSAPGASFAVSAFGNDPSRGGTVRAFNDGE